MVQDPNDLYVSVFFLPQVEEVARSKHGDLDQMLDGHAALAAAKLTDAIRVGQGRWSPG